MQLWYIQYNCPQIMCLHKWKCQSIHITWKNNGASNLVHNPTEFYLQNPIPNRLYVSQNVPQDLFRYNFL
jgi:hypothetical protein